MKNTINIEPFETDHMPIEVATSMLTAPKAKLTNRIRKNCHAARWKVYRPAFPLRETEKGVLTAPPTTAKPNRNALKFSTYTFEQLNRWHKRAKHRRAVLQAKYTALMTKLDGVPEEDVRLRRLLGQRLELYAVAGQRLDEILDFIETELERLDAIKGQVALIIHALAGRNSRRRERYKILLANAPK